MMTARIKPGTTVRELLRNAESSLPGISSARLDVEVLLAKLMHTERAALYAHPEWPVATETMRKLEAMLRRRRRGYPLAYLSGRREFWSMQLEVNEDTLIPRPETELLVETALALLKDEPAPDILDLGTGSGAIALALARERPDSQVLAVDRSEAALSMAVTNARTHELENIEFLISDWFTALPGRRFALIVSNPPYVESADAGFRGGEIRYEPRLALDGGAGGLQALEHIIPAAGDFLKAGAMLIVEHGCAQAEAVCRLFDDNHYLDVQTRVDIAGLARLSFGHCP